MNGNQFCKRFNVAELLDRIPELREILLNLLVASAGSATAMLPPPLCTSFNVAEVMEKTGAMAVFRGG